MVELGGGGREVIALLLLRDATKAETDYGNAEWVAECEEQQSLNLEFPCRSTFVIITPITRIR